MPTLDLQAYLAEFPAVCKKKFGRTYNFRHLERDFEQVGAGQRWLAARDVVKLFDPNNTPFARYWPKPTEKELDAMLKAQRLMLAPMPPHPLELVQKLLAVLHNTGVVSIILRFACPERFGIFSTPVLHLVQVQRPKTAELYLAYCEELDRWRQHFRMASVAETEMALWTFHELTSTPTVDVNGDRARQQFEGDVWVQRRRVAQVLRPFLNRYGALELARILTEEDPNLAGKIAGEEYERLLRVAARRFYPAVELKEGWAKSIIDRLGNDGHITLEQLALLHRIWEIRNHAVHATSRPSSEEVESMVNCIEAVCVPWEKYASKGMKR